MGLDINKAVYGRKYQYRSKEFQSKQEIRNGADVTTPLFNVAHNPTDSCEKLFIFPKCGGMMTPCTEDNDCRKYALTKLVLDERLFNFTF